MQIEVGHPHDPLDIRAADKGARHHLYLLVNIRLHRQPFHQRLEDRLCVHKNTCRGLVSVGDEHHNRGTEGPENKRRGHRGPALEPESRQQFAEL